MENDATDQLRGYLNDLEKELEKDLERDLIISSPIRNRNVNSVLRCKIYRPKWLSYMGSYKECSLLLQYSPLPLLLSYRRTNFIVKL